MSSKRKQSCSPKLTLRERRLLSERESADVSELFTILANDTRLRIVHALAKEGDLCVSAIADLLGMKPQAISNQLQKLSDRKILDSRRDGNQIYYRIVDPCVTELLDLGLCLVEDSRAGR